MARTVSAAPSGTMSMRSLPFSVAVLKRLLIARLEVQQYRLDVLAGAEAVDPKIHATA